MLAPRRIAILTAGFVVATAEEWNAAAWEMDTSLATADASFIGEYPHDYAGHGLTGAGDVNGDGYDDFMLCAWNHNGQETPYLYLVFGHSSGWAMDTSLSNADASFIPEPDSESCIRIAGAGDVNGDGFDDLLFGDPDNDEADSGQAYLVLGRTSGWAAGTSLAAADASYWGESSGDSAGSSVAGIGDIDGDGLDDFAIGAPEVLVYWSWNETWDGLVYVIHGRPSGWAMDTTLALANTVFFPDHNDTGLGSTIAGIGDVNGDTYPDMLITGTRGYLFLGVFGGWPSAVPTSAADATFLLSGAEGWVGFSPAGDVNGDGLDDFLFAAYLDDEADDDAGQTWLFLGRTTGWAQDTSMADADASFWGEHHDDWSGGGNGESAAVGAGDVDGDGYDDLLIGAYGNDDVAEQAGQAYIVFGKATGWAPGTSLALSDASFLGEEYANRQGQSVAGAGDVDGDGYMDLLIGSSDDYSTADAGRTYLILGYPHCQDDDHDGFGDPGSPECESSLEDCDDADHDVNPGVDEDCFDGIDNDCDGDVDGDDADCDTGDDDDSATGDDDDTTVADDDTDDDEADDDATTADDDDGPDCRCQLRTGTSTPRVGTVLLVVLASLLARRRRTG